MAERHQNYYSYKRNCLCCGKEFYTTIFNKEYCSGACEKKVNRKKKKKKTNIAMINEYARKEGLTYGQYVAKYGI